MYKIYADDTLIYDSTLEDYKIKKGVITLEADKASAFEFSLYPDHFYYNSFKELKTLITVYKSNRIKFRGRILKPVSDYWNNLVLSCEGERTFLRDTVVRPFTKKGTPAELFKWFINNHNGQVEEAKHFKVGTVTVTSNSPITITSTDYEKTIDALSTHLLDTELGGHLYITHGEDGKDTIPTIHYLADFTTVAEQSIDFGVNLKDFSKLTGAEDVATAIIPLGATVDDGNSDTEDPRLTIASVNNGVDYVYSPEGVERYGWIFSVLELNDISDARTLKAKAEAQLESSIHPNLTVELTAIDLHLLDRSIESYNVCEYIVVNSAPHGFSARLLCNKQTMDLLRPENDTVTIGHTYPSFTETSTKALSKVSKLSKVASSALIGSAVIVDIISRLDALEGVNVLVSVTDTPAGIAEPLLNSFGVLLVAGRIITTADTALVVTGGSAAISYTLSSALTTARTVVVNGETLGTVAAVGDKVETTISVASGSKISVEFIGG